MEHDLSRILVVGDSHCHGLDVVITDNFPNIQALSIARGKQIQGVQLHLMNHLHIARQFDPTLIIIHVGHNELAHHKLLNPYPLLSIPTAASTIALARQIQALFLNATIFLSAVLPRTIKMESSMDEAGTLRYNKVAKKHGQRIRTEARRAGFQHLINQCMWEGISRAKEDSTLFRQDGLHLNPKGRSTLTASWINAISTGATA